MRKRRRASRCPGWSAYARDGEVTRYRCARFTRHLVFDVDELCEFCFNAAWEYYVTEFPAPKEFWVS